ncbi:MAG: CbtA family protein [Rhizobiaceae bacterium]
MTLFRNVFFVAVLSGLFGGVVLAALQSFTTVPLILQAETFENAGGGGHHAVVSAEEAQPASPAEAAPAAEEEEGWGPADGFERFAFNVMANVASGIGFALLLVAGSELLGGIAGWRRGLFWGFAGFAIFTLAPGLGLPPELPAMPAADLMDRQIWWVGTVIATAIGLALVVFRRDPVSAVIGVALIAAPHIIGAPQPVSHDSPIPPDLHQRFVVLVTLTNLAFWLSLGAAVGSLRQRFLAAPDYKLWAGIA